MASERVSRVGYSAAGQLQQLARDSDSPEREWHERGGIRKVVIRRVPAMVGAKTRPTLAGGFGLAGGRDLMTGRSMVIGDDEDDLGPYASPPCFLHELDEAYLGFPRPSVPQSAERRSCRRLLSERPLPPYAYLPGRFPHPVRDPRGHSYQPALGSPSMGATDPNAFLWGMDLFNHGYYWEAHEAWEALWRTAGRETAERNLLQDLILLAAMGVKLRECKLEAARRHGKRAASFLGQVAGASAGNLLKLLGLSPACLAARAENAVAQVGTAADLSIVFNFELGRSRST